MKQPTTSRAGTERVAPVRAALAAKEDATPARAATATPTQPDDDEETR